MSAEPLARIFGPDLIELLGAMIRSEVEQTLAAREAERRWLTVAETAVYLGISEKAVRRSPNGADPLHPPGAARDGGSHALDRDLAASVR